MLHTLYRPPTPPDPSERQPYTFSNGILAESGDYAAAAALDDLHDMVKVERTRVQRNAFRGGVLSNPGVARPRKGVLSLPPSLDAASLKQAHWGLVLPPAPLNDHEKKLLYALSDLIALRQSQSGQQVPQLQYRPGWTADEFLWEEGRQVEPGNMQPNIVPYYLLVVGSPERIPWDFQQQLDGEYAVGRIWFDDPEECRSYVRRLIEAETSPNAQKLARETLFVAPIHTDDPPTASSAEHLIKPLYAWLGTSNDLKFRPELLMGNMRGMEASKARLLNRLRGYDQDGLHGAPPAVLFSAGHGLEFSKPTNEQLEKQGSLLLQEWAGPNTQPQPRDYLSANDIRGDMNLGGMIGFCFGCYSAGTPLEQDWVWPSMFQKPARISAKPFVARLPQRLLAQGMLAYIGNVSRAWDFSFLGARGVSVQSVALRETLHALLMGKPVGLATDYMNARALALSTLLEQQLAQRERYTEEQILAVWQARNDCRGFVILGDPATRLKM